VAIAIQVDPDKAPTGCSVPTIVPVGEFLPGQAYEFDDETGQKLLDLPDGPFMRVALKVARAQATEQETQATEPGKPATPEAASTESEAT
jgi:hypothetical protein